MKWPKGQIRQRPGGSWAPGGACTTSVLDTTESKGKRGAFGSRVQKKMVDALVGTGPGDALSNSEALGVAVQVKNYLQTAGGGEDLSRGVKAALAGSVLNNLPQSLPTGSDWNTGHLVRHWLTDIQRLSPCFPGAEWDLVGQGGQVIGTST